MTRTKGATNKDKQIETISMPDEQRMTLLANLILEIVSEEETQD